MKYLGYAINFTGISYDCHTLKLYGLTLNDLKSAIIKHEQLRINRLIKRLSKKNNHAVI